MPQISLRPFSRRVLLGLGLLITGSCLPGQVLLVFDIADMNAVTITATGAAPAANFTPGANHNFPVRLLNFFSASPGQTTQSFTSSTLKTLGADHTFTSALTGRSIPGVTSLVLSRLPNSQEVFNTGSPAFTGVATVNLSSVGASMVSAGAAGDIMASDGTTSVFIGTYSVISGAVPEPATCAALMSAVILAFTASQRPRRPVR